MAGVSTKIQHIHVGVEIGQVLALTAVLIALSWWRTRGRLPAPRLRHQHRVEMRYRPWSVLVGGLMTLCAALIALIAVTAGARAPRALR